MCRWIVDELGPDVPLHFSAFHPDFMMTARKATPADTLVMAYDTARRAGLRYVYTGNVIDRQRQATYCPGCGQPVIQRDGYLLGEYSVRDGRCTKCNGTIAGRFDNAPGTWGGRRQPVRIAAIVPQLPPAAGRAEAGRNTPQAAADERARSKAEMVAKEATQVATCPHPNPFPEGEETKAAAAASPPEPEAALPAAEKPAPSAPVATSAADNTPLPTPHSPPPTPQVAGPSPPAPDTPDRPALSEGQEQRVFQAAGRRVVAAVRAVRLSQSVAEVLDDAAETPVYGAFVSLKRGGQLRSCCGFLGQTVPLREALDHAALRAAKDDPRFPPISPTELDHLDMEVWLLWGLQPVKARGQDRIQAITIGKHGLQIARGNARGLLLPGVATEHRLDAKAFLQQVCLKAGLPPDAWLRDDTTLMTFEGYAIHGRLATTIAEPSAALPGAVPQPDAAVGQATRDPALVGLSPEELDALARFCRSNLESMLCGATPSYYLPGAYDGAIHGVVLSMEPAGLNGKADMTALSLRADMPLQSTLFNVAQSAAGVLRSRGIAYDSVRTMPLGLTVLADPAMHGTAAEPDLKGFDPRCRALLVNCPTATALIFDPARAAAEVLQEAVTAAAPEDPARAAVFTLAIASTEPRVHVVQRSRQRAGPEVRPAAVAGAFYPGSARDVHRMLDELFSEPADSPPERWAGALVPHAGWVYSGRLAAKVLRRVAVPDQVVILCPRHRPGGAEWAVAPHARWSFPNGELAADTELAHRLAAGVEGLELDALAHQQEHAIEVQLPLLARVAPNVRIVAITVGQGDLARLQQFGRQMAAVLQELPSRPLLLISSDMNHFANDVETRRLDRMALDAIEALDPVRLFQTVERNRISMCGMRPAVVAMEALRHLDALDRCEVVGYTTSAEASGDPTRVVGYAGVLFGGKESGGGS
jgi:AmmeMemoRadiSam system protein B/AmmeMemoRadiSam system protein A